MFLYEVIGNIDVEEKKTSKFFLELGAQIVSNSFQPLFFINCMVDLKKLINKSNNLSLFKEVFYLKYEKQKNSALKNLAVIILDLKISLIKNLLNQTKENYKQRLFETYIISFENEKTNLLDLDKENTKIFYFVPSLLNTIHSNSFKNLQNSLKSFPSSELNIYFSIFPFSSYNLSYGIAYQSNEKNHLNILADKMLVFEILENYKKEVEWTIKKNSLIQNLIVKQLFFVKNKNSLEEKYVFQFFKYLDEFYNNINYLVDLNFSLIKEMDPLEIYNSQIHIVPTDLEIIYKQIL